jgi:hypothetical protein
MSEKRHEETGASDRTHGTHGKGDSREHRTDEVSPEPATKSAAQQRDARRPNSPEPLGDKLTGQLGDASWGDAGSGGSTIDKRSPDESK